MLPERKALGKGLSSLIPLGHRSENVSGKYFECNIEDIVPNQNQPRKLFDKSAIDELAASIEEKGIIQPLLVRKLGGGKYEIIAGERRFRASQSLGLEKIPVILREADDQETLELALIENLQRRDLNPIEEALAYKELLSKYQYTQDELAKRLGKDRSSIANSLRLLKLPEAIRSQVITGKLSMGHARAILSIDDHDIQLKIVDKVIDNNLSVREIEDLVREMNTEPATANITPITSAVTDSQAPVINTLNAPHLVEELKKHLKTKVLIRASGKKGKIILHYQSMEEFNRLYNSLLRTTF